jgi:predicted nucleic acid-binding protein
MYLDSAYVAKYYLNEHDSPAVRRLIHTADSLVSSEWSVVEVACAFHRHFRQRQLTARQYRELLQAFLKHADGGIWALIPLGSHLVRRVTAAMHSLPAGTFLRAGAAVQLVSAQIAGEVEVWTNDRHVLAAAPHFGLAGRSV